METHQQVKDNERVSWVSRSSVVGLLELARLLEMRACQLMAQAGELVAIGEDEKTTLLGELRCLHAIGADFMYTR